MEDFRYLWCLHKHTEESAMPSRTRDEAKPALLWPPWFDRTLLASLNHAWGNFWDFSWLSLGKTGRQSSDYSDSPWPNKDLFEVCKVEKFLLYVFLGKIFIGMRLFRCGLALRYNHQSWGSEHYQVNLLFEWFYLFHSYLLNCVR